MAASFWTFGAIAMAELLLKLEISRGYLAVALPAGHSRTGAEQMDVAEVCGAQARRGPISNCRVGHRGK